MTPTNKLRFVERAIPSTGANYPIQIVRILQHTLQRTWSGLTDDEIEVLFQTAAGADEEVHIRFARAIESKLKEVNT